MTKCVHGHRICRVVLVSLTDEQIILRARQKHLFEQFRDRTSTLSYDLIDKIHVAWKTYVLNKVSKALPDHVKPQSGEEDSGWLRVTDFVQDSGRKAECAKRDEKFDMYLTAAVCGLVVRRPALTSSSASHFLCNIHRSTETFLFPHPG